MKRKNIEKIFKNSLSKELKEYFKLIKQAEKVQKNFNIKDMISYDKFISVFKSNLDYIQESLFLELYNKPVVETDFDAETPAVSLFSVDDFKNEFLWEEIIEKIYLALIGNHLSIRYTSGSDHTKDIIAMRFDEVEIIEEKDTEEKSPSEDRDHIFIHDEEEDGQIKKLLIKRISSITILPY